jgi:SNF2 family DNA or RNA helicase
VIEGFRQDDQKKVFLISLKAGGTGLNLTEADVVIHYDPWWNPAIEDQATSRAHRIGQRSVVTSYKLITKGTIEEKIVHLQQKKRELFQSMVDESSISADNLSWDDVQDLLDDSNL